MVLQKDPVGVYFAFRTITNNAINILVYMMAYTMIGISLPLVARVDYDERKRAVGPTC